eukprot:Lithocolla_globosa_v1_NODE_337_length_4409_cov_50.992421.p4 type:complete len:100 gc:universal NODE_337_length_4409_cov_50.992421:3424-3723(+)
MSDFSPFINIFCMYSEEGSMLKRLMFVSPMRVTSYLFLLISERVLPRDSWKVDVSCLSGEWYMIQIRWCLFLSLTSIQILSHSSMFKSSLILYCKFDKM